MLDEMEGVLIAATEPPFNKQGAKFHRIKRFQQAKTEAEPFSPSEKATASPLNVMVAYGKLATGLKAKIAVRQIATLDPEGITSSPDEVRPDTTVP
jgi:hypothetical protein